MSFEVETPIINSPFLEPREHWQIRPGATPFRATGRRRSVVYQPPEQRDEWDLGDGTLAKLGGEHEGAYAGRTYEMVLVNRTRERLAAWRAADYAGATRTTRDLIDWWRREDRFRRLFFAQIEAVETIIFLREARADLLQGLTIPPEALTAQKLEDGHKPFLRLACKMATGSGKTTVMGMLAAWSILNKVADRTSRTYSDAVLVVCPNVTIRDRLRELDPKQGDASIYRTRDLVPPHLMPMLARGSVLVTNWHVFEPQSMQQRGIGARVVRAGVPVETTETIIIGDRNTTARGSRYMTRATYEALVATGEVFVKNEELDNEGNVRKATIFSRRWVESDTALLHRVLEKELGKKQSILVMNDEAHHAYRIHLDEPEDDAEALTGTAEDDDELAKEATVWVDGLDRVHKHRGINFAVDLSATPYFLARAGRDTARPFPWTVSDFGLVDAIESGLVKIPQLPLRDTTGADRAPYFNIWEWVKGKLTSAERGGRRGGGFKPEAVLKYAFQPIAMLAGDWREAFREWQQRHDDPRPPVFIIVCRDTRLAKVIHEWIADDTCPEGIPSLAVAELRNDNEARNTIRVDSKVVSETDAERGEGESGGAKADESRWMRFTLDTIGKTHWPLDRQGRELYPTGFEDLARKLERPLHPPGRDVRCIVSVGMLTEGWDANTVTHIIGLRPFMSQLLCEQVVGRGLRRVSYDVTEEGLFAEEVAQVFGVPFEVIPFKASGAPPPPRPKRYHVHALEERAHLEIRAPRVEGYVQAVRNRVAVEWAHVPTLVLTPGDLPTVVETGVLTATDRGRVTTARLGSVSEMTLAPYHAGLRLQEGIFQMARDLTQSYLAVADTKVPAHVLFPQVQRIVQRFVTERVQIPGGSSRLDVFTAPYYGWALEMMREGIRPDVAAGEMPELPRIGRPEQVSTSDVDFWTSRDVRDVEKSHVNYVVLDTARWEQQAAFYINNHRNVEAFVKHAGMDFSIPYVHNGQKHDFFPDFIVKLRGEPPVHLILETKGFDPLAEVKAAAAQRWVRAVNADGRFGAWAFAMARKIEDVSWLITVAHHPIDPIQSAREYGIDISQLEESLRLTPAERLERLDENAAALRELRAAVSRSRDATRE
ncbi:MAG: BPTD_3080 family restriction endonuclease [Gemmatimonadaceae bacterium]